MFAKLGDPEFLADVRPLLTAEEAEGFDEAVGKAAFGTVFSTFIIHVPGKLRALTRTVREPARRVRCYQVTTHDRHHWADSHFPNEYRRLSAMHVFCDPAAH